MKLGRIAPLAALFLLAACGNTQRVEQSVTDVHTKLAAMPAEADAMQYLAEFPEADYFLEDQGNQLVWHFRHYGKDYGRFIATLEEAGPNATNLTTSFENSNEAELASKLGFLRTLAKKAAEASVDAALHNKRIDQEGFHQMVVSQATRNPMAMATTAIGSASAAIDKEMKAQNDAAYYNSPVLPEAGVLPEPGVTPMRGGERERLRRERRSQGLPN